MLALALVIRFRYSFHSQGGFSSFSMGKQSEHSYVREIWAVVLVGCALLLLLSLVSYNTADWPNSSSTGARVVSNFIGPTGAWLAFATFQTFGIGAYVLMVLLS